MKKKNVLLSTMTTLALITICYQSLISPSSKDVSPNSLIMENIEALTQTNDVMPKGWSSTHLACFQTVTVNGVTTAVPSGKSQGITWPNDRSTNGPHSHACSYCSSI